MLKCIPITSATKLGPIATTYRAHSSSPYKSCPVTCPLLPLHQPGAQHIDEPYLETVLSAVPRRGVAWAYTHFSLAKVQALLPTPPQQGTTLNISTDTMAQALDSQAQGWPTVFAAPYRWEHPLPTRINNVRFIPCPAALRKDITCAKCGGGEPLCARRNRDYVVVFPAHGTAKHLVGQPTQGGCYGSTGNTAIQWKRAAEGIGRTVYPDEEEREGLKAWTHSLPARSLLRHHIVGDLGQL